MDSIQNLLDNKPIIGIIPEDEYVKKALVREDSVFNLYPDPYAGKAYNRLAHYLAGDAYVEEEKKKGLLHDFLEILGFR